MSIHSDATADGRTGVVNFYTILHNKRLLTDFCQRQKTFTFFQPERLLVSLWINMENRRGCRHLA